MKFISSLILLLLVVAGIAFYSKPNDVLVREKVADQMFEKAGVKESGSTTGFIVDGLAKLVANKSVVIEDKVLFKKVKVPGSKLKGIGAFGTVFFY